MSLCPTFTQQFETGYTALKKTFPFLSSDNPVVYDLSLYMYSTVFFPNLHPFPFYFLSIRRVSFVVYPLCGDIPLSSLSANRVVLCTGGVAQENLSTYCSAALI